jgi:hypothetical protein
MLPTFDKFMVIMSFFVEKALHETEENLTLIQTTCMGDYEIYEKFINKNKCTCIYTMLLTLM